MWKQFCASVVFGIFVLPAAQSVSAKYSKMEDGHLCSGPGSIITTEADCKAAADELNLKWEKSWNGKGDFPGCLHANDGRNLVYFNKSPSPSNTANNPKYSAICKLDEGGQRQCMGSRRRIRRNVNSLSSAEKERLQKALNNAINSTVPWENYKDVANFHGAPWTLCEGNCCPHGYPEFLPWHRLYTVQMEQLLNCSLPYWDWTETGAVPDLWEDIAGPFKEDLVSEATSCLGSDKTHHRRGINIKLNKAQLKTAANEALETTNFRDFTKQINGPHDDVHTLMKCDMFYIETAAYDPVFYLHHSYVDYLFAFWQELQKLRKEAGFISVENDLPSHILNIELEPFDRLKNNPFPITRNNSRVNNTFDYRDNLCYEYDNLTFEGMTPLEFLINTKTDFIQKSKPTTDKSSNQFCRNAFSCRVFVGIFLPKNATTSLIEFQICTRQNRCVDAGSVATFGSMVSEIRNITNPSGYFLLEYEVTDTFQKEAMFDGDMTARISSVENPKVIIGLDPVMIWRVDGGVERGTAVLSQGSRREDYGTLLDKFDEVVENIID